MRVSDFAINDQVVHRTAGSGIVIEIAVQAHAPEMAPAVVIDFSPSVKSRKRRSWRGAYPQCWLDQHPGWLKRVTLV